MSKRISILKLLHIDWDWIWQRPQALACELADKHDVKVFYRVNPKRWQLTRHHRGPPRWPLLPIPERALPNFARTLHRAQISLATASSRPDVIWITHPDLTRAVPEHLWGSTKIVYDCMDYAPGFALSQAKKEKVMALEEKLVRRADLIICSSSTLVQLMRARKQHRQVALIENGIDTRWLSAPVSFRGEKTPNRSDKLKAYYFGTVSRWIDWDLIDAALNSNQALEIHMFGPVECPPEISHQRLWLHPPVTHGSIPSLSRAADLFILPFKRNDLVEHVNPVKLYEYIALERPIIALDYAETRRFLPWVNLFSSAQQFMDLITDIARNKQQVLAESRLDKVKIDFLNSNTWSARALAADELISSMVSGT